MKKNLLLIASAIALITVSCNNSSTNSEKASTTDSTGMAIAQTFNLDTSTLKPGDKFYQCEMNPEVLSDKPGSCPTCGMDLSEIKKQ